MGSDLFGRCEGMVGGHGSELAGPEVIERLLNLGIGVHDERAVPSDWFFDGLTAEEQHLQAAGAGVLGVVRLEGDGVAGSKDGQVTGGDGAALCADATVAAEDVEKAGGADLASRLGDRRVARSEKPGVELGPVSKSRMVLYSRLLSGSNRLAG